ncbi:uncharacterized protein VTP21DRAFT_3295 [Calcarisporiella thermophila]|uniref:uncharacterized protein n=1 Tax=Calcarisporiella thermophila TaxID=911321 RepID=UPI00374414F0
MTTFDRAPWRLPSPHPQEVTSPVNKKYIEPEPLTPHSQVLCTDTYSPCSPLLTPVDMEKSRKLAQAWDRMLKEEQYRKLLHQNCDEATCSRYHRTIRYSFETRLKAKARVPKCDNTKEEVREEKAIRKRKWRSNLEEVGKIIGEDGGEIEELSEGRKMEEEADEYEGEDEDEVSLEREEEGEEVDEEVEEDMSEGPQHKKRKSIRIARSPPQLLRHSQENSPIASSIASASSFIATALATPSPHSPAKTLSPPSVKGKTTSSPSGNPLASGGYTGTLPNKRCRSCHMEISKSTCGRRGVDHIPNELCNSCGLRLFKGRYYCPDRSCYFVPSKSEYKRLKASSSRPMCSRCNRQVLAYHHKDK